MTATETLTPERAAKKSAAEAKRDAPCPESRSHQHDDPDNSGQCIYCRAALDIIEGLDY